MQNSNKIKIAPPKLHPHFTNIGYGNPRYNSMVVCPDSSILISCGPTLRRVDLKNDAILMSKQIGHSQIFQIIQNTNYVMVINFDGLVSLLDKKQDYGIVKQFYTVGKEVRHSSISQKFIAVSCELNEGTEESFLSIYSLQEILQKVPNQGSENGLSLIDVKPIVMKKGYYYYPELFSVNGKSQNPLEIENVLLIQYNDPNPKGRQRKDTVMNQKLPIKHKILEFRLASQQFREIYDIKTEGQILCASHNHKTQQVYYLHQNKKITVASIIHKQNEGIFYECQQTNITASSAPHCLQAFQNGLIYCSKSSELTYLTFPSPKSMQQSSQKMQKIIPIKSLGVGGNFAIKASSISPPANKPYHSHFYFFNQNGLHYYCAEEKKTYSQYCFDITNCGLSLNSDGSQFVVADFGGNVFIFNTETHNTAPVYLRKTNIGIPVRTLTWCRNTNGNNLIVIGCVGGSLFTWDGVSQQANFLMQLDHTINILRYFQYGFVLMGTSDGFVHILHSETMEQLYRFQAHFPIHYENQVDRQLFGSMKNFAQIWSLMAYPVQDKGSEMGQQGRMFYIVTCCQDQTEKVFMIKITQNGLVFQSEQLHHLKGHLLAVTSIDWKQMGKGLGEVYVSCSDDKFVRFRDPKDQFKITHEIETSTIKQWHTLTYLCLEPDGHRVAVGSQNGYLFIFDIEQKQLLFGQKIHLGGIQGMDWVGNKLVTCSSDLCISVITF